MSDEIEGLAELRARLAEIQGRTQDLQPALLRAGIVVLKSAMDRIDAGGPGWPANKTHTPLLHKTGRLLASLSVGAAGNVEQVSGTQIVVGTNVEYARYLQDGTAYFARGSTYSAHGRKRDVAGPRARAHNGMAARPFLFIDSQASARISDILGHFVMTGSTGGAS